MIVCASAYALPWSDDMESGQNGWTATGLWHMADGASPCAHSHSPSTSWYYGVDLTCTYSTGSTTSGYLTSPQIDLTAYSNAQLSFWYFYQTETTGTGYDKRIIQIKPTPSSSWITLQQLSGDAMNQWREKTLDLSSYAGNVIQIRFYFDSIDEVSNNFLGWHIDDILVQSDTTPPQILSTAPADQETEVAHDAVVSVAFSEAMNPASVAISVTPEIGPWAVEWNAGSDAATWTHAAPAPAGVYTAQITGTDLVGNALATGTVPNPWTYQSVADTQAPPMPGLISPADAGYATSALQQFAWSPVTDSSGVAYQLQISLDPSFSAVDMDILNIGSASYTLSGLPPEQLAEGSVYSWRVSAWDGASNTSGFTAARSFTVDTTPPTTSFDSFTGVAGLNGWHTTAGDMILSASDGAGSGVAATYYTMSGPVGTGTLIVANSYAWIDTAGGTNTGLSGDDNTVTGIPIGFNFPFYDSSFSAVNICTNGFISFTYTGASYNNINFPNPTMGYTIAALWDDLEVGTGQIKYLSLTGPNRFVVEFAGVRKMGGSIPIHFQVVLHENGLIVWSFKSIAGVTTVTVGVNKGDGVQGVAWNYGSVPASLSSLIIANQPQAYTGPVTVSGDARHRFSVYSVDAAANAETPLIVEVPIDTTPPVPAQPSALPLFTFATDTGVTINWTGSPGSDYAAPLLEYQILRATDAGPFTLVHTAAAGSSTAWTDTALEFGATYTYKIVTYNQAGLSAESSQVFTRVDPSIPVPQPTAPNGTFVKADPVLMWNGTADGEVTYDIQISADASFSTIHAQIYGIATQTYQLDASGPQALMHGVTYHWRVRASSGASNSSDYSAALTMTADTMPPVTTATLTPGDPAQNGWYLTPGQLSLSAMDSGSGLASTFYAVSSGGYELASNAYSWIEISDGTNTGLTSSIASVDGISLGFSFPFYGSTFDTIRIFRNGFVSFSYSGTSTPSSFPSADFAYTIAALANLFSIRADSAVFYKRLSNPDRFIVQWEKVYYSGYTTNPSTFQIVLHPNGLIVWNFKVSGILSYPVAGVNKGDGINGKDKWGTTPSSMSSFISHNWLTYNAPIALDQQGAYLATLFSEDNAGNRNPTQTIEYKLDYTPPSAVNIDPLAAFTTTNTVFLYWDLSSDPHSRLSETRIYRATGTGEFALIQTRNPSTQSWSDISVVNGETYTYRLVSVNGAGLTATGTLDRTTTIDTTVPLPPAAIRDGLGPADKDFTGDAKYSANWDPATDPESGIIEYRYKIGTTPGGAQVTVSELSNGVSTSHSGVYNMQPGQTYYITVRARSGAGYYTTPIVSNGMALDATPPGAIPFVNDGLGSDISYNQSLDSISANWGAAEDEDSGIAYYAVSIGTTAWSTDVAHGLTATNTFITVNDLTLAGGASYYVTVAAMNSAGLSGPPTCSNGQMIDTSILPAPRLVYDGHWTDQVATSTEMISMSWTPSTFADRYWIAVSSHTSATQTMDVQDWIMTGPFSHYVVDLTGRLSHGHFYYLWVKAEKLTGKFSEPVRSNGFVYDIIPPEFSGIADAQDTGLGGQVRLSWPAAGDHATPVIYNIYYALQGTPLNFASPQAQVSGVLETMISNLPNGATHTFAVRAMDSLGQEESNSITRDAQPTLFDVTPPGAPENFIAMPVDSAVSLAWKNPDDADFSLCRLIRSTTAFPATPSDGVQVYSGTSEAYNDTGLANGTIFYYTLFACDQAGNCSFEHQTAIPRNQMPFTAGWNLFSVPHTTTDVRNAQSALVTAGYQIFSCSPPRIISVSGPDMVPAKAYWIYQPESGAIPALAGLQPITSDTFAIALPRGWNGIANPYPSNIFWSDDYISVKQASGAPAPLSQAVSTGLISAGIWFYDPGRQAFVPGQAGSLFPLVPWHGYAIKVLADNVTVIFAKP
jgi:hypothetical protein